MSSYLICLTEVEIKFVQFCLPFSENSPGLNSGQTTEINLLSVLQTLRHKMASTHLSKGGRRQGLRRYFTAERSLRNIIIPYTCEGCIT